MAKQGRILPARRPRHEESLLLRSAESLGRMIGSLQRQLDDAAKKLTPKSNTHNNRALAADKDRQGPASTAARRAGNGSPVRVEWKKSKRAAKSAASRKSSSPTRSGAARRARKAPRRT